MNADKTISAAELISLLEVRCRSGAFAATLETLTIPAMRKTDNPHVGNCFKRSRVNVMLNWIYENAVNRQRDREDSVPDFEAQPRKWGTRIARVCFVAHKENLYVEAKVQRSLGHSFEDAAGNAIPDAEIAPFLPAKRDEGEAQGLEQAIIIRDYNVDSIVGITLAGETFRVERERVTA